MTLVRDRWWQKEKGLGGFLSGLSPSEKNLWEIVEWGGMDKLQSVVSIGGPDKIAAEYAKLREVMLQQCFFPLVSC